MLVGKIAPAPSASTFLAHFTASIPAPLVPAWLTTSKLDGILAFFRVSMATEILSRPNFAAASFASSFRFNAAVLTEGRSPCALQNRTR